MQNILLIKYLAARLHQELSKLNRNKTKSPIFLNGQTYEWTFYQRKAMNA